MAVRRERERRISYRANDGRPAVLRLGRRRQCVATLAEVSAGGFSLDTNEPLSLDEGACYPLRTSAGWSEVRLIHHREAAGKHRYGLQRLGDYQDHRADQRLFQFGGERLRHNLPQERIAGVGYFLVLGFALAVYYYYSYHI